MLKRSIPLGDFFNQLPMYGDRNRKIMSAHAREDMNVAIEAVESPRSFSINGVSIVKFNSANVAIDIPHIMLTKVRSFSRERSNMFATA